MSNVHVIIPAAGHGNRFGRSNPKQFTIIHDKTILEHAENIFAQAISIHSIYIALNPEEDIFKKNSFDFSDKTKILYTGGEHRSQTVFNSLSKIVNEVDGDDWIIVHDAARIGLNASIINNFVDDIVTHQVGGIMALPVPDTVKKVNNNQEIVATENRDILWLAQTPQMFRYKILIEAFNNFNGIPTDESEMVEALGLKPVIIRGNMSNFKITYPEDLKRAEQLIQTIYQDKND